MDVDLIECGSDNCNYPLTSCKSVALRNRLLSRNVQSKLQMGSTCSARKFDTGTHCVAGHLMHVIVVPSDCVQEVQSNPSLEQWKHKAQKFPFQLAAPNTTCTSAAVNKYLRQSPLFHPYISQTLNPVWDAFTAIWSMLSHSLHTLTHTYRHIYTHILVPTKLPQFAWLPLYFIMCHVAVWDMVPDFIYVEQWWLSYQCCSEIAVDQYR